MISIARDEAHSVVQVGRVGSFPLGTLTATWNVSTSLMSLTDNVTGRVIIAIPRSELADENHVIVGGSDLDALQWLIDQTAALPVPDFVAAFQAALTT